MDHSPPPLMLLAGFMTDERVWQPFLSELGAGREMVVVPTHDAVGVSALATSAIASLPPGPFAIAAHSLGGLVAMEICRRVGDRVAGLALLSTGARAESPEGKAACLRMIDGIDAAHGMFHALVEMIYPRFVHPAHGDDVALRSLLVDMATRMGPKGFVRQHRTAMSRPSSLALLRGWLKPTLVLCGEDDQLAPPEMSEEMAYAASRSELVVVPNAGHMVLMEQPAATLRALRAWLERVDAEAPAGAPRRRCTAGNRIPIARRHAEPRLQRRGH